MTQNSAHPPVNTKLVVGGSAPIVTVKDHQGEMVTMSSLWQSRPCVLLFVRHFG